MKLAVLPGDDIGPEITEATLQVLRAVARTCDLTLDFDVCSVGLEALRRFGTTLPKETLESARAADGILLGPAGMNAYPPSAEGGVNIPGTIRKALDLFANIRPARSRVGVPKAQPGLDCIIVRENTEGFYADRNMHRGNGEFMPTPDVAMSFRVITANASNRISRRAFEIAQARKGQVTFVGKRHVLQITDGLFWREASTVAAEYPDISLREMDVDAVAAEIYSRPGQFDVILTSNMYGDILSNLANALAGSVGLAASLNVGHQHAAANAGHGSAPDIAGKNVANPLGLIVSSALLLDWFGRRHGLPPYCQAAERIEAAVDRSLKSPSTRTRDLGGTASTDKVVEAITAAL